MISKRRRVFLTVIWMMVLTGFMAGNGWAWYDDQFEFRRRVGIDTTSVGADIGDNLSEVPVLIRLHSGNFDFTRVQADGKDLRFVLPDDKTLLKHHIERFDSLEELAFIWVNIPKISGKTNEEFIYLYYGNTSAPDSQSPSATYDARTVGVYHLNESEGAPGDTSSFNNTPSQFSGGLGFPGVIGNGVTFSGIGDRIMLKSAPSLSFKEGVTFSLWVKISGAQNNAFLFHQKSLNQTLVIGIDGSKIYASATLDDGTTATTDRSLDLPFGSFHYLTVTFASEDRITLFFDGIQMGWAALPFKLSEKEGDIFIGSGPDGNFFSGDLDEIVISNVSRNSDMIRASFASQGPSSTFFNVGEEISGGGGGGLSSVFVAMVIMVLKNITLDGWVIIGILILMGIWCWIIFFQKTYTFITMERENKAFVKAFESEQEMLALSKHEEDFPNSPLFKIYYEGVSELEKDILPPPGETGTETDPVVKKCVSGKRMSVFKAALEKGFVNEGKVINSGLIVLTLSISGGPFLGLLGTVWGVMTTFAAMAEAGEADIMAIAPGVASALATTVVGLIVAIPALFAYNYLAVKTKNLISECSLFIDEFTVKADATYGE